MVEPFVDAYAVLGVPEDADQATIKDAHRKLAWRYHPDRVTAEHRDEATRRIQDINRAYGLVRTPAIRARYDALRRVHIRAQRWPDTSAPSGDGRVGAAGGWAAGKGGTVGAAGGWAAGKGGTVGAAGGWASAGKGGAVGAAGGWASDWDDVIRQAGRWAGRWWKHNEGPLRRAAERAARQARRTYVRVSSTITTVLFAWLGLTLAVAAQQFLRSHSLLPPLVGGVGGAVAGALRGRERMRALEGHPLRRRPWALVAPWLTALSLALALDVLR